MGYTLTIATDENPKQKEQKFTEIQFSQPTADDAVCVNALIAHSPPLDPNSLYCNLLQCTHFADTSVCAKQKDKLLGFISAYKIPYRSNTLFVWQVAVAASARGKGLAGQMLYELLRRPFCKKVSYVETTVTDSNYASWSFFNKFARKLEAKINTSIGFEKQGHFQGRHETENFLCIGPFSNNE